MRDVVAEDRPGTARMVAALDRFLEDPVGIVTIWGPPGNGKTLGLKAAVIELNAAGVEAIYVTAPDVVRMMRAAMYTDEPEASAAARETLRRLEQVTVLALDDLDTLHATHWEQKQLNDFVARRYARMESTQTGTLIAMRSDPAQLVPWIASRLADGRNVIVYNDDPDLRGALKR